MGFGTTRVLSKIPTSFSGEPYRIRIPLVVCLFPSVIPLIHNEKKQSKEEGKKG